MMFESLNGEKQLCTVQTINFRVAHMRMRSAHISNQELIMMEDSGGLTLIDLQTCNHFLLSVMELEKKIIEYYKGACSPAPCRAR